MIFFLIGGSVLEINMVTGSLATHCFFFSAFTIDMPRFPVFIQDISIDSAMCMSDRGLYNFFQTTIASVEYMHTVFRLSF